MLLFCLWAGHVGPGRLNADKLQAALEIARSWGQGVTGPLRAARRALKDEKLGGAEAQKDLREGVIRAERRSEQVALSLLERLAPWEPKNALGPDSAHANLEAYLAAVGCERDADAEGDLELLVQASGSI